LVWLLGLFEVGYGTDVTIPRVREFVDEEKMVVFSVGVVVDVETPLILPITINTADKVGNVLTGGVDCFVLYCC